MAEGRQPVVGIVGGSGVYELDGLRNARWEKIESPFGAPSDELLFGELGGVELVFLPRHGRGHRIPPSEIDYRANIDALKSSHKNCTSPDLTPGSVLITIPASSTVGSSGAILGGSVIRIPCPCPILPDSSLFGLSISTPASAIALTANWCNSEQLTPGHKASAIFPFTSSTAWCTRF